MPQIAAVVFDMDGLMLDTESINRLAWQHAAEDLGYTYIEVPDHVFGATARDGWVPLYNEKASFHETFVTLGFLAAVTKTIRLSSGILIAPQRQTGVIAKQAAEVDLLSGGRLRLGIGLGWNHVEYQALGAEWKTRGARQAEQAQVLRRLWSESLVSFNGRFHNLNEVSIVPPPVQRPIPIWFGGSSDAAVTRAARLGDGWMPIMAPDAQAEQKLGALREQLLLRLRVGCHDWHPAIAKLGSASHGGVGRTPKPDGDRTLHRRWHNADFLEIVEAPIEAHEILRPKATQHPNLFGLARSARLPLRAERFILNVVPSQTDAKS